MWYAKMYFSGEKEFFENDAFGMQGLPSKQLELPFLESLLTFLELDENHNHRPCRWFAQAPLGPITSRAYRLIESSFYCMMRPTAIEIAAWRILLFVSPWLSVFLNHTLSPAFQTCSSLRSDIFSGHS